ncbi:hypothetical protein N0V88_001491 [Collariella sp. IMI 366227]|nr:hypothetical protein N0V88_001491 [Collariella sp. IMI 366227]
MAAERSKSPPPSPASSVGTPHLIGLAVTMLSSALLSWFWSASPVLEPVGKLPALGFNTWNMYQCDYTADELLTQAKAMVDNGLVKAGYDTFMLDDCYSLKERDDEGRIVADPDKFPHGMKHFTTSLSRLGFRAGIYSDAGHYTCAGYPGSFGHEADDLQTFAAWGFEYLKYDNCYIPFDNVTQENVYGRYART